MVRALPPEDFMSAIETSLQIGQRVVHSEFGEGVVVEAPQNEYVRAFFPQGERQVPIGTLRSLVSRNERILRNVEGSPERLRKLRLVTEAYSLPLMESAVALMTDQVDLFPHQVVLTHRIATAS